MSDRLPYPPPWQDISTLYANICVSERTVDAWVAQGILPPPRKRGGKLMWKWSEVDELLTNGPQVDRATELRNAMRKELGYADADQITERTRKMFAERDAARGRAPRSPEPKKSEP